MKGDVGFPGLRGISGLQGVKGERGSPGPKGKYSDPAANEYNFVLKVRSLAETIVNRKTTFRSIKKVATLFSNPYKTKRP